MRKIIFLIGFCVMNILVSCGTANEVSSNFTYVVEEASEEQQMALNDLKSKVDSLNGIYLPRIQSNVATRGKLGNVLLVQSADEAGKIVGAWIGKHAGATIGASLGNPVTAVGGYVVGRYVGKIAGSAVASYGCSWLLNRCGGNEDIFIPEVNQNGDKTSLDSGYESATIREEGYVLSDGELHNEILNYLMANPSKYEMRNGSLNYSLLLEDAFYVENMFLQDPNYELMKDAEFSNMLEETKRVVDASEYLYGAENVNNFLNKVYVTLIPQISVTRQEFDNECLLNETLAPLYASLSSEDSETLADAVDVIIDSSDLDENRKSSMKSSNDLLYHSAEYWKNVRSGSTQEVAKNNKIKRRNKR